MPQYKGSVYPDLFLPLVDRGANIRRDRIKGGCSRWTLEGNGRTLIYETNGKKSLPEIDELYEWKPGATSPYTWEDCDPHRLRPGAVEILADRLNLKAPRKP